MFGVIVTGGIAMGKSTVMGALAQLFPAAGQFDADLCVSDLLTEEEIRSKVQKEFGRDSLNDDGSVNREFLRKLVFDSAERRAALEGIMHPEVRQRFDAAHEATRSAGGDLFFADVPLFYESNRRYPADSVLVVAAPSPCQRGRLLERPGITEHVAEQMISAQLPITNKMAAADTVIWNSGSLRLLRTQIDCFAEWLKTKTRRLTT